MFPASLQVSGQELNANGEGRGGSGNSCFKTAGWLAGWQDPPPSGERGTLRQSNALLATCRKLKLSSHPNFYPTHKISRCSEETTSQEDEWVGTGGDEPVRSYMKVRVLNESEEHKYILHYIHTYSSLL